MAAQDMEFAVSVHVVECDVSKTNKWRRGQQGMQCLSAVVIGSAA